VTRRLHTSKSLFNDQKDFAKNVDRRLDLQPQSFEAAQHTKKPGKYRFTSQGSLPRFLLIRSHYKLG
jgi:hypothetical protein